MGTERRPRDQPATTLVRWVAPCISVLVVVAGCSKQTPPTPDVDDAPLRAASAGVLVRKVRGECTVVPCPSKSCQVSCPPRDELAGVDLVVPLRGKITVSAGGHVVLDTVVRDASNTGLAANVGVRPVRWPIDVEVRVDDRTARIQLNRESRFAVVRPAADGGLEVLLRSAPTYYE